VSTTETTAALEPDPATDPTEVVVASRPDRLFDAAVVAAATLVVVAGIAPQAVLTDVLPWRTDLTGHVVVPWLDRQDLTAILPGAWSDAMFSGFPLNQLYPWLPSVIAALLSLVMPLAIAFKVTVVAPLVALPWAAWRAGTWSGLPRPVPAMLSVAMLPLVYDTSCVTCGGTISSTINGEYAFAWAMLFGVLALGAVTRLARTGRGPVLAALLAAAAAISHPLPAIWLVIGVFVVAVGHEVWADPQIRRPFGLAALAAALMSAMWWLPFLLRRDWMPILGFPRRDDLGFWLLPASIGWEVVILLLAVAGTVWAIRRRSWFLIAVAIQSVIALAAFWRIGEGGQLYNLRVLPFWYFGRWTLAAVGLAWLVALVVRRLRTDRTAADDPRVAPVAALLVAVAVIGSTWGWWGVTTPATDNESGRASVLGLELEVTKQSTGPALVLGGPDTPLQRAAYEALEGLIRDAAAQQGCGRIAWDETLPPPPSAEGEAIEVAQAPWQSPIWSDGCITPITGILTDSSATAPTAILTQDVVSTEGLRVMQSIPDAVYDLEVGVTKMRTMGVRYYLTVGGQPAADAAATDGLTAVAKAGPWELWEIDGFGVVSALPSRPAVVEPAVNDADWILLSHAYFLSGAFDITPLAQTGPDDWQRVALGETPSETAVPEVRLIDVSVEPDRVSFRVDRTGVPVIVRLSTYPGWTVEGADAVHRATPNWMIVVPTSEQVTLSKQRTPLDWIALALGVAGLALAIALGVGRSPRTSPAGSRAGSATARQGQPGSDQSSDGGGEADVDTSDDVEQDQGTTGSADDSREDVDAQRDR
jgi:hypothetical protein